MDELLQFANRELDKGYSPNQVRNPILRGGYSPAVADGVMQSVLASRQRMTPASSSSSMDKRINAKIWVGLICAVLLIAGGITVPILMNGTGSALLDVSAQAEKESYYPADNVGFNLEIFNMGSKDRFDITLQYKIFDTNDNLITAKEETVAISTSTSYRKEVRLPSSIRPGSYSLKVFALYDDKVATSAFTFDVLPRPAGAEPETPEEKPTITAPAQRPVDNTEPATNPTPSCSDERQNQDEEGIDCGGICGGYWYDLSCHISPKPASPTTSDTPKRNAGTIILDARLLAKANPEEAKAICLEFEVEKSRDDCLKSVAQSGKRNDYCEIIIDDDTRDLCYYPFFMEGDYSVCDKLVLKESLKTCSQLKEISKLQTSLAAEGIGQTSEETPNPDETLQ